MKSFNNSISYFFRFLFLLIFIWYYSSINFFYHAHLINGQIVYHSHFYKFAQNNKSPFKTHSHSSSELTLIQDFNHTVWSNACNTPYILKPISISSNTQIFYEYHKANSTSCPFSQFRAPPTC